MSEHGRLKARQRSLNKALRFGQGNGLVGLHNSAFPLHLLHATETQPHQLPNHRFVAAERGTQTWLKAYERSSGRQPYFGFAAVPSDAPLNSPLPSSLRSQPVLDQVLEELCSRSM